MVLVCFRLSRFSCCVWLWVAKVVFCFGSFSVVGCCTLSRLFRSFKSCFSLFPIFKSTSVVQLPSFSEGIFFILFFVVSVVFWSGVELR